MSFSISKTEIDRRMDAFNSLLASLILGLVIFSVFVFPGFITVNFFYWSFVILVCTTIFLVFRFFIIRFFEMHLQTKFILNDKLLERKTPNFYDSYMLASISQVNIKRTTRGSIREIGIRFNSGKTIFLDGLDKFEKFKEVLIVTLGKDVKIKESYEKFDYDSPRFYPLLGLLLGLTTVFVLKFFSGFDYAGLKIIYIIFTLYFLILGIYFIFEKPLSQRYGNKRKITDLVLGLLMIGASITFGLWILISYFRNVQ